MEKPLPIDEIIFKLTVVKNGIDKHIDTLLRVKFNITESQLRILMPIFVNYNTTQKEIACFWNISEAAVNRQISILIKSGYLKKDLLKHDTRKNSITLTPKAIVMIKKIMPVVHSSMKEITIGMDKEKKRLVIHALDKIISNLNIQLPPIPKLFKEKI